MECLASVDILNHPNPLYIIDLIFGSGPNILSHLAKNTNFMFLCLNVPFKVWPNKGKVISELFLELDENARIKTAEILANCKTDSKTELVGSYFLRALSTSTSKERYQFLYKLTELIPDINVSRIFNCPFPSLVKTYKKDPECIRRLAFNTSMSRKVLFQDNLLMGLYKGNLDQSQTFIAFDKNSSRIQWAIPLGGRIISWNITTIGVALIFHNEPLIHLIDPVEGKEISVITLPTIFEVMYITPSGFCFFEAGLRLYGGQIAEGKWTQFFQIDRPRGAEFTPHGDTISFKNRFKNEQLIISQDGSIRRIKGYDFLIKQGTLYTLEKPFLESDNYTLVVQPVDDTFQFKGERKEITLKGFDLKLETVCDDDTVVVFSNSYKIKPNFVELKNQKIIQVLISANMFVDVKSSAVWVRDYFTNQLWKHTNEISHMKGELRCSMATHFVHVDEKDQLYFADIPG